MINHIRVWNIWRKCNRNNIFYKILVLLGLQKSPTMECYKYITSKYSITKQNGYTYVIKEKENEDRIRNRWRRCR